MNSKIFLAMLILVAGAAASYFLVATGNSNYAVTFFMGLFAFLAFISYRKKREEGR